MKKTWTIAAFMVLGLLYVHDLKSQVVVQPVFQAVQYTAQLPGISTVEPTQVSANMAIGGGIISHDGGAPLIAGGLVWSTTNFPSVEENEGITYDGTALGVFTSTMTELSSNTVYYVRAYATNIAGTAYGEEFGFITEGSDVFICGDPLVDARDGQSYATIQIGAQCWMAENLNVGTMIQGNQNQTDNGTIEKYCYNNSESNCETYGGLYQWNEAMAYSTTPGSQGICPEGWYIPNDAEWTALTDLLGGEAVAGAAMKEAGTTHWFAPNTGATNSSGYTGLPGGNRGTDGSFSNMAFFGNFWTSTPSNEDDAWRRFLSFNSIAVNRIDFNKQAGFSVRCRKDDSPQINITPTSQTVSFDAGTATLLITSNTSWTVTENTEWFTVEPSSGENNALLTVSYTFNESAEPRSGEITLTAAGGSPVITASITQEGYVWSCGYPIEDERDGQVYNTVQIGNHCWLAENLNLGQRIHNSVGQTDNGIFQKYCYANLESNCDIYGGLYQWNEMMQYHAGFGLQGICPEGWHLPEQAKWNALVTELGGAPLAGGKMKATGTIEDETGLWYAPNTGADNSSGLSVFPAGERIPGGSTANLGYSSILWSTTHVGENVLTNELTNDSQEIFLNQQEKGYGYSVRCVKDEEAHTFLQINTAWKAFSYEGGEAEFSITSNTNWTLTNIPEWLSVDTTTASGDSQFTLTCEYNPLTEPRVATLNLEANDNVIELHITQEPFVAELTINPPYKAVPYTAFTTTFEVLSNTSWVVIENESWFDVTPLSGSNNGTLTLNHQENTTSEKRTGQFIVLDTSANILITVMIIQVSSGEINCGEQLVDSRDGQSYATIQIGNQCWMTENLAYLPQVSPSSQGNQVDPYYYVYNYQGTNVNTAKGTANYQNYGVLYNAPASTTACPDGWYLPKDTDWALLIDYVVSLGYLNVSGDANGTANALKSCRQVNSPLGDPCNTSEHPRWNSHGTHHGFDEFGFSALPGGQRRLAGNFNHLGEISNWWSSTIISHTHARVWEMYWDRGGVNKPTTSKSFGASIRCISNESAYAVAPFVTTTPVSEITPTTAISGGDIAFDGGAQITARGVCWSTEPNPTIEDNITTGGTGLGWFTSELTGLTPETTYYVRAYATNIAGAGYGEEFSFTTDQLFEPTITTAQVSAVTPYSATSGGDVTDDGNATVTARGVVWSTSVHPTIETYEGITTDGLGLGEFVSQITGLTPETTYFVRAYATNIGGTAYGEELSFTTADLSAFACGEPVTDLRDGQSYETVQIGDQCWMKGNLKYLPSVVGPGNSSQTSPYHYVYDYNGVDVNAAKASANFNKYGVLYNWPASLSACPFGWGLPSDDDWDELTDYLETQGFPNENVADGAGNSLKSCRQVNSPLGGDCSTSEHPRWNSNNTHHGFDEFDFFALPGGMRNTFDVFGGIGRGSYWWSSTAYSSSFSYSRSIRHEQGNVSHGAGSKSLGLSVRCLYVLSVPSVTTSQVNQITANTGIVVGNVTDDGNDQVITRGVVWSSSVNPTIENNEGITTEGDDLGEFISQVTGLSPETTYYVRAYATNILGAGYGDALSFTTPEIGSFACGDDITFTYRGEQVTYGTVPLGILCWLDRNMGASRVPASMTDSEGFGDLFQWGRLDDGHQDRQSNTTPGPINHDVPGHDEFLTLDEDPWDWRSPQNNDLWQGVNGINNPCPDGWRVPTETELNAQRQSWSSNNSAGAYASTLKWPVGGYRGSNGTFNHVGSFGIVWSSSVSGANARLLYFNSGDAVMSNLGRAGGMCVRCVRD